MVDTTTTTTQEPTCYELYGPYPKAVPVPFSRVYNEGREGDPVVVEGNTATAAVVDDDELCDVRDARTPDNWVHRDGTLVRLTGKHPFNCEPPVAALDKYRFITPSHLHYVRNHGICPKLDWNTHTVSFTSETNKKVVVMSMDKIVAMPSRELPVTLVCAGNRRKEQNQMRQTIGFSWGPAGVATNVWKGTMLRDILITQLGIDPYDVKSWNNKHVEFIGVEDLPNKVGPGPFIDRGVTWDKTVKYGTSIPLSRAMNPAYDVLIAYEANGQRLLPDHGFPVRLIIPGYIGGRMIKWLKYVNVIHHETYNHYHYHDNRILPPNVITSEESLDGGWWYKPEYIFNELNINSAITRPDHNSVIDLDEQPANGMYEVAGYAYTGGGRQVTRVMISLDHGDHWILTDLHRKERPNEYGMYWCWIWWTCQIPISDLVNSKKKNGKNVEIWCRAWDDANNGQAIQPTWNLMGMGNNHVFRVKVHMKDTDPGVISEAVDIPVSPIQSKSQQQRRRRRQLVFEHPTQPGQQKGGWMTNSSTDPQDPGKFGVRIDSEDTTATSTAPSPPQGSDSPLSLLSAFNILNWLHLIASIVTAIFSHMGAWFQVESSSSKDAPPSLTAAATKDDDSKTSSSDSTTTLKSNGRLFTMDEIRKHDTIDSCWIVVNNRVYDCTKYLELHPGGVDSITMNSGGIDATDDFVAIHSTKATQMLEDYYIGDVITDNNNNVDAKLNTNKTMSTTTLSTMCMSKKTSGISNGSVSSSDSVSSTVTTTSNSDDVVVGVEVDADDVEERLVALDPKKKTPFRLRSKVMISRDSFILDFELPTPRHVLGLPTGKHVFLSAKIKNKETNKNELILRRYTPITSDHDVGCVKFVIKAYRPCERFPLGGKMSQYLLDDLHEGDYLDIRGPVGEFTYVQHGRFILEGHHQQRRKSATNKNGELQATHFNMIAGGTGITPCMQIAAEILREVDDIIKKKNNNNNASSSSSTTSSSPPKVSLIYACREEGDLLLRETLDEWARKYPNQFFVHYILSDKWSHDWKYSTGFVDRKLFEQYLYPPSSLNAANTTTTSVYNLMCGPPIMLERGCLPNLKAIGHDDDSMFSF